MNDRGGGVVLLATPGPATSIIYHALARSYGSIAVVLEQPVSRWQMARRRAKRLGIRTVAGQLLFVAVAVPLLRRRYRGRARAILDSAGLDDSPIEDVAAHVSSVNSDDAHDVLRRLQPRVVVVNGTRIISAETLACVDAPFVNMHAGITPQYRGVHGGYWALVEGRPDLVGTTVHFIDTGIDTGPIIGQATFEVTKEDSFATYPYLHVQAGLPILLEAVGEILAGRTPAPRQPHDTTAPSRLRTHPTLGAYVMYRLRSGVA